MTECIVKPARDSDADLLDRYEYFFGGDDLIEVIQLDWQVVHMAGLLRGQYQALRTPDAIHVAAAMKIPSCEVLLTGDKRLSGHYIMKHVWTHTPRPWGRQGGPIDVISFHGDDQKPFNSLLEKAYHR